MRIVRLFFNWLKNTHLETLRGIPVDEWVDLRATARHVQAAKRKLNTNLRTDTAETSDAVITPQERGCMCVCVCACVCGYASGYV